LVFLFFDSHHHKRRDRTSQKQAGLRLTKRGGARGTKRRASRPEKRMPPKIASLFFKLNIVWLGDFRPDPVWGPNSSHGPHADRRRKTPSTNKTQPSTNKREASASPGLLIPFDLHGDLRRVHFRAQAVSGTCPRRVSCIRAAGHQNANPAEMDPGRVDQMLFSTLPEPGGIEKKQYILPDSASVGLAL